MEVPETIDMLYCLKEVCSIYSAKPERVAKVRKTSSCSSNFPGTSVCV